MSSQQPVVTLNDGSRIPWLAIGTGTALFGQDATNAVQTAIATGVRHLDCAQMYQNEDSLGAGIKASGVPRSELYIVTKLGSRHPADETVKTSLERSLKKLNVDYVDLFLIHSPQPFHSDGRLKKIWKEMEEVKKEGLAKSIGVSNFRVQDLQLILEDATILPSVNQIELHPYVWKAAEPIIKLCAEKGIAIESYGGLTPLVRSPGGPVDAVLDSIASRIQQDSGRSVTPNQVLNKWLAQQGVIVVTTSKKESRIKEALDSINLPDLTTEEVQAIIEAGAGVHKRVYMKQIFDE